MTYKQILTLLVFAMLSTLVTGRAFAADKKKGEEPPPPSKPPETQQVFDTKQDDRVLKMHQFLRPYNYPLAIPTTNVGIALGYAYGLSQLKEKSDFLFFKEDKFQVGGLAESLNFEYEFINRLSFEISLQGRALAGADDHTALVYGGQALYSASFTPKVNIVQSDSWGSDLAIAADLRYDQGVQSSPIILMITMLNNAQELLNKTIETGDIPSEKDVKKLAKIRIQDAVITQDVMSVRPALLFAQTFHPVIGVQLNAAYDYGFRQTVDAPKEFGLDAGDPPTTISGGATITLDFGAVSKARFGLKFDGDYQVEDDDGEQSSTMLLGGGFIYTGRRALDLGATVYMLSSEYKEGSDQTYFLNLNMSYYF